ncbi:hypothetical protein [Corynebacterium sp. Marseille-P4321]|nr:hypothetical protein [Corynebacterium sp. Marseille-P4321]
MDLAALIEPILAFFSQGIGKAIADALTFLYHLLFPANAPAATPVPLPN